MSVATVPPCRLECRAFCVFLVFSFFGLLSCPPGHDVRDRRHHARGLGYSKPGGGVAAPGAAVCLCVCVSVFASWLARSIKTTNAQRNKRTTRRTHTTHTRIHTHAHESGHERKSTTLRSIADTDHNPHQRTQTPTRNDSYAHTHTCVLHRRPNARCAGWVATRVWWRGAVATSAAAWASTRTSSSPPSPMRTRPGPSDPGT